MTLFEVETKPLRAPRRTHRPVGDPRPEWSDYRVKTPVKCDDCLKVAYETLVNHEPYPGVRNARFCRRQGNTRSLLCAEHAQILRELDRKAFPPKERKTGQKRVMS